MKKALLVTTFLLVAVALATVTFDPATGIGFVGKGDIQIAYGWNNAQLQANAAGLSFTWVGTATYDATCEFTNLQGNPKESVTHTAIHTTTTAVNDTIAYESRKNSQGAITGFNLTGFGTVSESGDPIPSVGDYCPGGNVGDGRYISVVKTSDTFALNAVYDGIVKQLLP
jgi:hypothetical protein